MYVSQALLGIKLAELEMYVNIGEKQKGDSCYKNIILQCT